MSRPYKGGANARFEAKFMPEPNSGCWLWIGSTKTEGYGNFSFRGVTWTAHRASWQMARGDIPHGMCVLHKCDTPACVNPDHLFLGTHRDNTNDKITKKRHRYGESQSLAKLTDAAVRSIRKDTRSSREIADELGVTQPVVIGVRQRKSWQHVH